jgi:hypothetical protein
MCNNRVEAIKRSHLLGGLLHHTPSCLAIIKQTNDASGELFGRPDVDY